MAQIIALPMIEGVSSLTEKILEFPLVKFIN
jgi:hypothetical protein